MVILIGVTWLLFLSGFFVFWTPLPLIYQYSYRGRDTFLLSALIAFLGLLILYAALLSSEGSGIGRWENFLGLPGFGFREHFGETVVLWFGGLYFFYFIVIAGMLGLAHEKKFSVERGFALAILVPLLVEVIAIFFVTSWFGIDVIGSIRGYLHHLLDRVIELGGSAGLSGQEIRSVSMRREEIAEQFMRILPAGVVLGTLITVWCNVVIAKMGFLKSTHPSQGLLFEHFGNLSQWRFSERFVWLVIGAGCLYFLNYYISGGLFKGHCNALGVVSINVLLIFGAIYFLQGLAIVAFFVKKHPSILIKVVVYSLIALFFHIMAIFIAALGIFDIWFDFRKLNKGAEATKS